MITITIKSDSKGEGKTTVANMICEMLILNGCEVEYQSIFGIKKDCPEMMGHSLSMPAHVRVVDPL